MGMKRLITVGLSIVALVGLTACGGGSLSSGKVFGGGGGTQTAQTQRRHQTDDDRNDDGSTIWDLFQNIDDPNTTVEVNRYIWNATMDVLSFMPVEAADPFSGIIVFGYGTPPGGRGAYKATVHVNDPALDARSLNVSLYTRAGPASSDATHAIEDAILTRARQMRIADGKL